MPGIFHFPYWRNPYYYQRYQTYYNRQNPYHTSQVEQYPKQSYETNQYSETKHQPKTNQHYETNPSTERNRNTKHEKEENKTESRKESKTNTAPFPANLFQILPTSIGPLNFHPDALTNSDIPLFELFGIELFLDDIIIICILIFLYQEEVKDEILYISLIILLFS